jgi:hypothetical protein
MAIVDAQKPFTLAEMLKLERGLRLRNIREWIACSVVVVGFLWIAFQSRGPLRIISAAEVVAAAVYIALRLHRDGSAEFDPGERAPTALGRQALARELRRQAALLDRAAVWYVAPLAVGWLGLQTADLLERGLSVAFVVSIVGGLGIGVVLVALNRRAARRMSARASELEFEPATE